jgi:hypothetical protein
MTLEWVKYICSFTFLFFTLCVFLGPFAWLFGLYHAQIPQGTVTFRGEKHEFNPGFMIIHSIKHHGADNCANNTLYDQRMIIGKFLTSFKHKIPGSEIKLLLNNITRLW